MDTPEMDKIARIRPRARDLYEFLDWVRNYTSWTFCELDDDLSYSPIRLNNEEIAAAFFGIDLKRAEEERERLEAYLKDGVMPEEVAQPEPLSEFEKSLIQPMFDGEW